jgi:hypothetical protein
MDKVEIWNFTQYFALIVFKLKHVRYIEIARCEIIIHFLCLNQQLAFHQRVVCHSSIYGFWLPPFVYSNSSNVWHYSVYLNFPFNDIYVIICYIEYSFPFHTQTSHQIIMCLKYKKESSVLSCAFPSMVHHNRKQLLLRNTTSVMFE